MASFTIPMAPPNARRATTIGRLFPPPTNLYRGLSQRQGPTNCLLIVVTAVASVAVLLFMSRHVWAPGVTLQRVDSLNKDIRLQVVHNGGSDHATPSGSPSNGLHGGSASGGSFGENNRSQGTKSSGGGHTQPSSGTVPGVTSSRTPTPTPSSTQTLTQTASVSIAPSASNTARSADGSAAAAVRISVSSLDGSRQLGVDTSDRIAELIQARASIPQSCTPSLDNGRFSHDFAQRIKGNQPLHYDAALRGEHGAQTWVTARLANGEAEDDTIVERTRMARRSLSKYCASQPLFRADHAPLGGCNADLVGGSKPVYGWPWCWNPSDASHVMSIDCGIIDNAMSHEDVAFTVYTDQVVVSADRGRWAMDASVPVTEFKELAVMGAAEYPTEPGHFPNEDLGALMFLDRSLPVDIPLLWPNGGIASHFLAEMRSEGLISNREMIFIGQRHERGHHRARRLYFFRNSRGWDQAPHITWYTQRLVQQMLMPVLAKRTNGVTLAQAKRRVVVLQRHGARTLNNHDELMGKLREWLPSDFEFDAFVPGPGSGNGMMRSGERIYSSCLLIGPHGGNMPNEMFLRQGCWVIEIGFIDPSFALPTDFYCFARNLGLKYWLSIAVSGSYSSGLVADMDDIHEIVEAYKKSMLGMG